MSSGINTVEGMKAWLAANPQLAAGVQIVGPKQDKFQLPTGEIIDGILAAGLGGGRGGPQWTGAGGTQNGVPVTSGTASASAPAAPPPRTPNAPGPTPPPAVASAFPPRTPNAPNPAAVPPAAAPPGEASSTIADGAMNDEVGSAIARLLARGETPVTGDDVREQYDPAARSLQRGAQRTRQEAAQRGAYSGTMSGGQGGSFDAEVNSINENLGEQEGSLMASLMGDEISSRRNEVVQALQFAQGEERMRLQEQLAAYDRELQRAQLGQQESQFSRTQDQQAQQFMASLDQRDRQFLAELGFRGEQLSQQDRQFLASLGVEGQRIAQQNQQFYDQFSANLGRDEYLFDQLYAQGLGGE